jgi:hypothetical protein
LDLGARRLGHQGEADAGAPASRLRLRLADDFAGRPVDARQADELPWLLRQARWQSRAVRSSTASLSFVKVCERLRLSQRAGEGNKKYADMPPCRLPDGRSNPAYFAARAAALKQQGKCRDCRAPLDQPGNMRCPACREDNNRRMREFTQRRKEVAA